MTLDVAGLVEHVMKAWLLLYLCQDSIALREKYHSIGKILFFLQTFLVGCWISESVWVNRILYGNEEGMVRDSSHQKPQPQPAYAVHRAGSRQISPVRL